jgi:transposase-like protein
MARRGTEARDGPWGRSLSWLPTTNALEREHEEVRRRTRVIRIFPHEARFLRLATALAAERNDVWAKRRSGRRGTEARDGP